MVAVGASGAVYGVYGALLGCYLRGVTRLPLALVRRRNALLLLFAGFGLVQGYLSLHENLIPHLAGALFGFLGGLLLGDGLRPRGWVMWIFRTWLVPLLCAALVVWTYQIMTACAKGARSRLRPYAAAFDRERELLRRFDDILRNWEDGALTNEETGRALQALSDAWRKVQDGHGLGGRRGGVLAEVREVFNTLTDPTPLDKGRRPSDQDFQELVGVYFQARYENLSAMAGRGNRGPLSPDILRDLIIVEGLRQLINEVADEENPLRKWLDFSKVKARDDERRSRPRGHPGR
jgi:hypothetical protein